MSSVILKVGLHEDCEIHKQVLSVRETKDGWFDMCSPIVAVFCGSSLVWTQLVILYVSSFCYVHCYSIFFINRNIALY